MKIKFNVNLKRLLILNIQLRIPQVLAIKSFKIISISIIFSSTTAFREKERKREREKHTQVYRQIRWCCDLHMNKRQRNIECGHMTNIGTSHLSTAGNMTKHLAWHERMKNLSKYFCFTLFNTAYMPQFIDGISYVFLETIILKKVNKFMIIIL